MGRVRRTGILKFLITGDWHVDKDKIKTRTDDVLATCMDKIGQIFQIAKSHECDAILQPGDFFESHKTSDFLKQFIINYLHSDLAKIPIFTVFGQHDLRYHNSNVLNTPLKVLEAAKVVNILSATPWIYPQGVMLYGASWHEDIPEILPEPIGMNILVCHKMVVDTKIWEGQEDHTYAKTFLLKTEYDLIVSGDNHKLFWAHSGTGRIGKRLLLNCGSLLRTRIDQEDHKPCVFIYNTSPSKEKPEPVLEQIPLVVEDFDKVIKIEEAKKVKEENENLKKFVDALDVDVKLTGLNYKRNVWNEFLNNDAVDDPMKLFAQTVFTRLEKENERNNKNYR